MLSSSRVVTLSCRKLMTSEPERTSEKPLRLHASFDSQEQLNWPSSTPPSDHLRSSGHIGHSPEATEGSAVSTCLAFFNPRAALMAFSIHQPTEEATWELEGDSGVAPLPGSQLPAALGPVGYRAAPNRKGKNFQRCGYLWHLISQQCKLNYLKSIVHF